MTKYKIDDNSINSSQVTLTSYMMGDGNMENEPSNTNIKEKFNGCAILDLPDEKYTNNNNNQNFHLPIMKMVKNKIQKGCTKKLLYKRIPILSWLPNYKLDYAVSDLVAGITVGLTVIPQAIAYSNVAGLPPQVGLYSSFMACFVYTIFGSCKDSAIGPTAISGLLTKENNNGLGVDGAVLLCFLSGCVEFIMGILQLGFLIDFISGPVSIGFTSAVAIIIATTQVKDILGLNFTSDGFLQSWEKIFEKIPETRPWDCILGLVCMVVLLILRSMKNLKFGPAEMKERKLIHNILSKFIWLISTSRNILVVVFSSLLAYSFELHGIQPFKLTGYVKPGLPNLAPPPFETTISNKTHTFIDMASTMGSALIVVPLLGILENIALAKVFADGKTIDATQEMLALGLCNIASSFVKSMPVTGALSRGAVNNASGVRTTLSGIYTGIIVILSLHLLTPYFFYIPKASLAAVIIAAVIFMVELHVFKPIWKTKKADLIPASATFLTCLFLKLEIGIVIGIGINVIFLLYGSARPSINVEMNQTNTGCKYLLITPDRSLTFPSVEYVRTLVTKIGMKQGSSSIPIVIDAKHIQGADFTAAKGIKLLIEDFNKRKQPIVFYNLKSNVINIFKGVQPKDFVYYHNLNELNDYLKQYTIKHKTIIP